MYTEMITLNEERNVTLTSYILPTGGEFRPIERRPVILVLPGGAYAYCSEHEADPIAFPYLKAGYHVCILRYSVLENAVWPNPLNDYESAAEYIRKKADEWNLYPDKLTVIGFSAGGHLAACAASMARNRPNAAILGYPVIEEKLVKGFVPSAPDAAKAVNEETCPCFIFAGRADTTVPVSNSIAMMEALIKYDISFESHIYAYARHGFGICNSSRGYDISEYCSRTPEWVEDSIEWLKDMTGDFSVNGFTLPKYKRTVNGNHEKVYSTECTLGHVLGNRQVMDLIQPYVDTVKQIFHISGDPYVISSLLISEVMYVAGAMDKISEVDTALQKIENIR